MGGRWEPAPLVVGAAAAALLLFLHGFVRLRRRGRSDHAGWGRFVLFVAGLACLTLPLVSPLDAAGDRSLLSAHMLQHMLVGDAGPALLVLAVRGPLLVFVVPAAVLRARALRRVLGPLNRPATALCAWAAAYAVWHVPGAYDFALRQPLVHELEHASFVLTGLLVWTQLVDPARHGRLSRPQRLAFAGAFFGLGQLLGDLLLFSPHPLYPAYAAVAQRPFGWSAVKDQQLAGLVMMGEQIVTVGTCSVVLMLGLVAPARRPALSTS